MKGPLSLLLFFSCICLAGLWSAAKWYVSSSEDNAYRVTSRLTEVAPVALSAQTGPPGHSVGSDQRAASAADTGDVNTDTANGTASPGESENGNGVSTGRGLLGADELQAREAARRQKLTELGIISGSEHEPTIAIDVKLQMPERCESVALAIVPVGVKFRFESSIIKGESLNDLESLVALYRECVSGRFILTQNPLGRADRTEMLTERRLDEIKYFFIQHSVPIDAVEFPEK